MSSRKIKFGVEYPTNPFITIGWDHDFSLECEDLGYDTIYLCDHLDNRLECWTMLTAVGTITSKIRLGQMVLCNSVRHPALLAQMATSLDIISKGRFELGIGAGWTRNDYDVCGIPYPKPSVRIAQLDESIQIIKKVWTEDKPSFKGKYYWMNQINPLHLRPVQKPYPPILIAGGGEKLLLRVVARHADICQPGFTFVGGDEGYRIHRRVMDFEHKMAVLRRHCEAVGRDFDEIEKMWWGDALIFRDQSELQKDLGEIKKKNPDMDPSAIKETGIFGTPDECMERIQKYIDIGVTSFTLVFRDLPIRKSIRLFAEEIMPQFT